MPGFRPKIGHGHLNDSPQSISGASKSIGVGQISLVHWLEFPDYQAINFGEPLISLDDVK